MMPGDASSLRDYLKYIDGSAPAIQGAAGAMMKHYDKSPEVAVGEWRNALIQARGDQYLPLLYVANEILQNSKRNRGTKFLVAFSPILGQSLIYVCDKSPPSIVESIRRTVKIWAERKVFSIRYVNELIKGLQPYRAPNRKKLESHSSGNRVESENLANYFPGDSRFSPVMTTLGHSEPMVKENDTRLGIGARGNELDETIRKSNNHSKDEDSGDDLFQTMSKKLLKINVDFDRASSAAVVKATLNPNGENGGIKRQYSSSKNSVLDFSNDSKFKRRGSTLSSSSLMEVMNEVSGQQASYDRLTTKLREIQKLYECISDNNTIRIETLIGNELLEEYKKTLKHEGEIARYKRELHSIATIRRRLELEAIRYLTWLERALKQDKDDTNFSESYRKQLELFTYVYQPSKEARERRRKEEALRHRKEEELRKKEEEEEECKLFLKCAMSKQTEAQPGMVWNRATGEYQHLNQEESWRD